MTFKQLLLVGVALLPAALPPLGAASERTALLQCRTHAMTCEHVDAPPFVHHPDVPEREQLASHNPEQSPRVLDTKPIAYDVGVQAEW